MMRWWARSLTREIGLPAAGGFPEFALKTAA